MALICTNCGKGLSYGHAVSHAKNRVRRTFKPNIQKLKVLRAGTQIRIKLCTSCIQRLKKDGRLGEITPISYVQKDKEIKEAIANLPELAEINKDLKKSASAEVTAGKEESLKIEDIVGKK